MLLQVPIMLNVFAYHYAQFYAGIIAACLAVAIEDCKKNANM